VLYAEPQLLETLGRLAALRDRLDVEILMVVDVPDPSREAEARAAHAARQARLAARQRARAARVAAATERTAEIIDISARVSDQLYDQYADAAVRAVGD